MASVNKRGKSGKLYIDFRYRNQRCREQTNLTDTTANRKKAQALANRIESEILMGTFDYATFFPNSPKVQFFAQQLAEQFSAQTGIPLFEDFVEIWFLEMEPVWRTSYRKTVRWFLDKRLLPEFKGKNVSSITKSEILSFRAQLAKVTRENERKLSPSYINRHMKFLQMILREAADRYEFTSPYRGIKPIKELKPDIKPFSPSEIQKILSSVREDYRDYFLIRMFTGMRTAEINGLQWKFVNLETRTIQIQETLVNGELTQTKTRESARFIQMSEPVFDALKRMREVTGEHRFVFCNKSGTPLDGERITKRIWYPMLKLAGIEKRRPYNMRHTAATLWLAAGENPEWVANQLGHTNTEMLFRVYSQFIPNITRQDGSAANNLFKKFGGDKK